MDSKIEKHHYQSWEVGGGGDDGGGGGIRANSCGRGSREVDMEGGIGAGVGATTNPNIDNWACWMFYKRMTPR